MNPRVLLALFFIALAGCSTAPKLTPEQIAAADCGPAPGEAERAAVVALMQTTLKDPGSAVYKWGDPEKTSLNGTLGTTGWRLPVLVNARNSFGGYVGFQQWEFLILYGKIIGRRSPDRAAWEAVK